ncbi:glycosyltransferase family 5 protein [Aulographum hederae CBS 113979]|uniref:alpha-1,3-glucan synthase n=1 Tax=Aulographum hederae CBS 113979 TaxID=1176131 RepID=A0A6G1GVA1_9PEZI|nr:glycosyltransferase family 5 protein [Aulographum hederae CBS 113979]
MLGLSAPLLLTSLLLTARNVFALVYTPEWEDFNLNTNKTATNPLDYWGHWEGHEFTPSPENWRMPFYSLFLDRFANGDPENDNINMTSYEVDPLSNQLRNGGDIAGLMDSLDYLQGFGIKGLYVVGSPFINQPWAADSYSPLDLTLLDFHFGNISAWRAAINEIHRRGMYVVLDNTVSTMGDLIGFEGYLNTTTPFKYTEHKAVWKGPRRYLDFHVSETVAESCTYPRFWDERGERVGRNVTDKMVSCLDSDFDQYGDVASFGEYPEWQKQLSKFGFVQDRLREWVPSVMDKIKLFSCIQINMLDIDGFRIDKGLTITLDAQAEWSEHVRECARALGKTNFFIPGEIVSGNALAALYLGRGKEPAMSAKTLDQAFDANNESNPQLYINNVSALDSAAFHYSVYRSLCRFLGIDGVYAAEMDTRINWVDGWTDMLQTNDMVNINTGVFDPRHMYGVTNHDVFRWPSLTNGTHKNNVGLFITTLVLPGISMLAWGEEQFSYILENTAGNYIFGRQPLTSTLAWQLHGCYNIGSEKYSNFPLDAALYGCKDDNVSLDHRDPSHPFRITIKRMFEARAQYPVLNDGVMLERLSNTTYWIYLPGSGGTGTEMGVWSSVRTRRDTIQDFSGQGAGNLPVWLVYGNENQTRTYDFNCSEMNEGLLAPYLVGTTVRNLFYPYESYDLVQGTGGGRYEGVNGTGCISNITMPPWGYKALVPIDEWVAPTPSITKFLPGHDFRAISTVAKGQTEKIEFSFEFSDQMDCDSVTNAISFLSDTESGAQPRIDENTINCESIDEDAQVPQKIVGAPVGVWRYTANMINVANGVHQISVTNATTQQGSRSTGSVDKFLLRIGRLNNPMVWPFAANYSTDLVQANGDDIYINHQAAGATKFRCTNTFASDWTNWQIYDGTNFTMPKRNWTGTELQDWKGDHVQCQYWSRITASSAHVQEGDLDKSVVRRRFPHVFVHGSYNQFGYDSGLDSQMAQNGSAFWTFDFMNEWPTNYQYNLWGMNPDGVPDQTWIFGDVDGDGVLDRIPLGSLLQNIINITEVPPSPYTAWRLALDDTSYTHSMSPMGSRSAQVIMYALLWVIPIATAAVVVYVFIKSFYGVKFNEIGVGKQRSFLPIALRRQRKRGTPTEKSLMLVEREKSPGPDMFGMDRATTLQMDAGAPDRRTVLIATCEYDIEDWAIKIKIGGLGVMAQLMGKNLGHQDLIWVVPCVGGIDYPVDQIAEPMVITILDKTYKIDVQYHTLRNITYVLLDAPVFRQQSKNEPYPARMDDLDSAIYYSAWNQCIAETIRRFPVDIYHINDYHGAIAPLYLLPEVIPACLSLHNAEFQGLWPMRTAKEREEVCKVFNVSVEDAQKYIQFGEVFNLLHAGASYLRIHQKGFGAVGVSKKYGKRSYARYPIFWGLNKIRSLPNPDPTDTAEWHKGEDAGAVITVDKEFEGGRGDLRKQAQEWAGLKIDPEAELFVFVGRWSMQKGVDLIADCFPSILENYPKAQLIAIGPVIDLYGRFAALKLEKMMALYPGRVFSKPEFTALPPYIFSGAEFALIPSRDEPFGLVAVEFGRKGALGVGSRVGGLGQMPGWWFTIESMTTKHLIHQFKMAIHEALSSSKDTRAMMRARSAKQRFPVAQWVEDLSILQSTSIKMSKEENSKHSGLKSPSMFFSKSRPASPTLQPNNSQLDISWPLPPTPDGNLLSAPPSPLPTPRLPYSDSPNSSPRLSTLSVPETPWSEMATPGSGNPLMGYSNDNKRFSNLSLNSVIGERTDFALQKVDPFFTDSSGHYYREFEKKLDKLGPKNSEADLCIEDHLVKSEKKWFDDYRAVKLRHSSRNSSAMSLRTLKDIHNARPKSRASSVGRGSPRPGTADTSRLPRGEGMGGGGDQSFWDDSDPDEFDDSRFMLRKIADWPVYSFFLAFGQIIAANSYQITLLTGEVGQTAETLYIIASVYAATSVMWWLAFRRLRSVYVLSTPFIFYGLAFLFIGVAPFVHSYDGRGTIQKVASGLYTVASSSGSIFFALNFGDEGGAPVKTWVLRACIIQGTQQIYVSALWFWGSTLTQMSSNGELNNNSASPGVISGICLPLAVVMWAVGGIIFWGLPKYYRQAPGSVPSFYKSVFRRKIILWFFIAVIIQNYWLSAPYGRNWRFLWTTQHASGWAILLLVILFFIGVWALSLYILGRLSKSHSWILPIFAIGLGAPRWAQMLWGTSGAGSYLPWAGSPAASALLARSLWLWLGVLDALQGVGFGMILLQTMTRFHNTFTLIAAQFLGSIATIVGRATAPDKLGPGPVFPNLVLGTEGLGHWAFWLCLIMQLAICVGFAFFFRKEQLSKP